MNLSLPYRWLPAGTTTLYSAPEVGSLVAIGHAVWRVIDVRDVPVDRWEEKEAEAVERFGRRYRPCMVVLRPVEVTSSDPSARDHDVHLRACGSTWHAYPDEHYPVCAECGEPVPCRDRMAAKVAAASTKYMDRFVSEGVCPACQEPVSSRQRALTFSENLEIPAGPPVTYHVGRRRCRRSAAEYEQRWVAADPGRRRARLSCTGHVINHNDGTYECSELGDCPGPMAFHRGYSTCRCPDCHARGSFGCHPAPDAALLRRDAS